MSLSAFVRAYMVLLLLLPLKLTERLKTYCCLQTLVMWTLHNARLFRWGLNSKHLLYFSKAPQELVGARKCFEARLTAGSSQQLCHCLRTPSWRESLTMSDLFQSPLSLPDLKRVLICSCRAISREPKPTALAPLWPHQVQTQKFPRGRSPPKHKANHSKASCSSANHTTRLAAADGSRESSAALAPPGGKDRIAAFRRRTKTGEKRVLEKVRTSPLLTHSECWTRTRKKQRWDCSQATLWLMGVAAINGILFHKSFESFWSWMAERQSVHLGSFKWFWKMIPADQCFHTSPTEEFTISSTF